MVGILFFWDLKEWDDMFISLVVFLNLLKDNWGALNFFGKK